MIDRIAIKSKAKELLGVSYIKNVAVSFILIISLYAFYSSGSSAAGESQQAYLNGVSDRALMVAAGILCIGGLIGVGLRVFVFKPLEVGCRRYFLNTYNGEQPISTILDPFTRSYLNTVLTMFVRDLFLFLWTMLFIIPGIIKSYSYRMVPYLLSENPEMSPLEVISTSRQLMNGRKLEVFVYDLSFIGWYLLAAITCNLVGIFYFYPYKALADAQLYSCIRYGIQPDGTYHQ